MMPAKIVRPQGPREGNGRARRYDRAGHDTGDRDGRRAAERRAAQGRRGLHRGGGGCHQPRRRMGGRVPHGLRGRRVAVSPLCRLRHRACIYLQAEPRRLRAVPHLSPVSGAAAVPRPHPLVGLGARAPERRDHRLHALAGRGLRRQGDRSGEVGLHRRRRLHRPPARGDAPLDGLDHARGGHRLRALRVVRPSAAGPLDTSRL